jgi:hypothetical protein
MVEHGKTFKASRCISVKPEESLTDGRGFIPQRNSLPPPSGNVSLTTINQIYLIVFPEDLNN